MSTWLDIFQYSLQLVEKIKKGERRQSNVSKEISFEKVKLEEKNKPPEKNETKP